MYWILAAQEISTGKLSTLFQDYFKGEQWLMVNESNVITENNFKCGFIGINTSIFFQIMTNLFCVEHF